MAKRFNLPSTGSPGITPAYHGNWNQTSAADRIKMVTTKISSSFATKADSETSGTQHWKVLLRQYISFQINAYSFTTSDTFELQVRCLESNAQANFITLVAVRVFDSGGSLRGNLYVPSTVVGGEYDNKDLMNRGTAGTPVNFTSAVSAQDGDYLVLELGFNCNNTKTDSYTGTMDLGDNSGTDLPEDQSETTQYNPWFEVSPDLTEYTGPAKIPQVMMVT